jgi:ribonuclease P protein component
MREADLPAEPAEAQQEARISSADAYPRGPQRAEDAAPARPLAALRLIWRVRGHGTFRDLARAPARRHGALRARLLPGDPDLPPSVAYAVPRAVGGAVERNRLRRRLRAAVRELDGELVPGGRYLLSAGPAAMTTTPTELRDTLRAVLRAARESQR